MAGCALGVVKQAEQQMAIKDGRHWRCSLARGSKR
jgi:hypothetical protein